MSLYITRIIHLLKNRIVLFIVSFIIFVLTNWFFTGQCLPTTETKDLWFYSGLFMVLFSLLFIEPYYSSPKNVVTNVIPLLLVFLPIKSSLHNDFLWWAAVVVLLILLLFSIFAIVLEDKEKSPQHITNKISNFFKNIAAKIGRGKILYSLVFIYFLLSYYSVQNIYTLILFIYWFLIVLIDVKSFHSNFLLQKSRTDKDCLGEIFGVQSKKLFLVKIYEDKKSVAKFDIVKFRYSVQEENDLNLTGIVFDTYLLNQEKWAKVLHLSKIERESEKLEKNIVYRISDKRLETKIAKALRVDDFVGVVIDGSSINKIRFEYSKKKNDLQEGDLLELEVGGTRLFYQVVNGITKIEKLELANETGFIEGDAVQLGEWQNSNLSFKKYGWVPSVNTPLFKANTEDIKVGTISYPECKLGIIPGTSLPSVINLKDAVSHHTALIGVTGSGKSFLAMQIINELLKDTKIVCIDFTAEWKKKLAADKIELLTKDNIEKYFNSKEKKIGIFELPALSNTTEVLKETQQSLEIIFKYAKKKYDDDKPIQIALVLEEAHTITPETSFLGEMGDYSGNKALVNKMTQIALQGRKYGVGLLVIAQRTANVSKTVLTQCNSVICFQAFDETSFTFLGNYVGKDMVQALPNLKQYNAIVAGKAIKSNVPMIVDLKKDV